MAESFFFYDLETSGFNPREARIMQFAGQRTDLDLEPIGEPLNLLVKMTDDILPDPGAILITGITPQQTIAEGITEAEFLKKFEQEAATPGTIFIGYNTVRFDDEFMRFAHYRNFYDPYEWQWQDGKSRWDLLDVVRMTRALRPEGIKWPFDSEGRPTNRLELLAALNKLDHENAHDALSDVSATIALAKLIKTRQPKLFDWLLNLRGKDAVKKFLSANPTFIYSSGKYSGEVEKTAVVQLVTADERKGAIVYDLRFDPSEFVGLSAQELADRWRYTKEPDAPARLPAKTLKYNRCPALAPAGLLRDPGVQERLKITPEIANANLAKLNAAPDLLAGIIKARDSLDGERESKFSGGGKDVDGQLYDGFLDERDRRDLITVRTAQPDEIKAIKFRDARLNKLLPLYAARNFPDSLTGEERQAWEDYRRHKLLDGGPESRLAKFGEGLATLAADANLDANKKYLLEELKLWAESIMPPGADDV